MDPDYYQEYFLNERTHWWFRARESILAAQVKRLLQLKQLPASPKILNIGAATGRSSEWLSEFGEVTSLEYDLDCCRMTRQKTGLDIVHGSIMALPFGDNEFDLVCAFDVIEHVDDDRTAVQEMLRVAENSGILFVTVPAYRWLWSEHDDINHHFRRYNMELLTTLFQGSAIMFTSGFNSLLLPPIALHRLFRKTIHHVLPRKKDTLKKPLRSDFSRSGSSVSSAFLERIFRFEKLWLNRGWSLPCGVSLMLLAQAEDKRPLEEFAARVTG